VPSGAMCEGIGWHTIGDSGLKSAHADLTWAFSEAAVLFLRNHPAGEQYRTRFERRHGQGQALTILAHTLARAVDDLLKRETAFELHTFLHT
jgi:hypothetical protein